VALRTDKQIGRKGSAKLSDILKNNKAETNTELGDLTARTQNDSMEINRLKTDMDTQKDLIQQLQHKLEARDAKLEEYETELAQHIERCEDRFRQDRRRIDENRIIANDVEARGRRWAMRILGMPTPPSGIESTMES
jgi:chromosome segregation ATPase